ncbi:Lrp/AsnC family transcriptional regulator [Candidatus Bathycorpusculum sp.]|uniref:siroheme decarboxylase subunit beta n=1 Tax=Candidatus Bathycorpusculum sp. TaxID=2994959 RepID=UPI0028355537|nr:Lrp/AsnC family transcriptional regulator [Candidatus Termitimicrobium sp.]MCL2431500.1 Lrp/AsnC family transcriptional regulator [Candidatus Termitimicrobium sp.]
MDEIDLKLLIGLKKGIPLSASPFNDIATELQIPVEEVISRLNQLKADKVIRRFGASIKPNSIGLSANVLVAWKVSPNNIQEVGKALSEIKEISHCYERTTDNPNWTYNLYTVLHAQTRSGIETMVNKLSSKWNLEYKLLYSTRDLKHSLNPKENPNVKHY